MENSHVVDHLLGITHSVHRAIFFISTRTK